MVIANAIDGHATSHLDLVVDSRQKVDLVFDHVGYYPPSGSLAIWSRWPQLAISIVVQSAIDLAIGHSYN